MDTRDTFPTRGPALDAFPLVIGLMKSKLQSSFDVGAIIEHIKAGMTANQIETDSKPLAVGDRRMIRLMDTAWFVGYQRWMSQSHPLIAFQHIHGALNLWYACGRLLPMDKEFLEQLVPMMACLGRGYTQQKWVESLNQLSQQSLLSLPWTNLQIIRAMSALEHEIFRTKLLRKKRTLGSLDKALQYVLKYGYKGLAFGGLNESRDWDTNYKRRRARLYEHFRTYWSSGLTEMNCVMEACLLGFNQARKESPQGHPGPSLQRRMVQISRPVMPPVTNMHPPLLVFDIRKGKPVQWQASNFYIGAEPQFMTLDAPPDMQPQWLAFDVSLGMEIPWLAFNARISVGPDQLAFRTQRIAPRQWMAFEIHKQLPVTWSFYGVNYNMPPYWRALNVNLGFQQEFLGFDDLSLELLSESHRDFSYNN